MISFLLFIFSAFLLTFEGRLVVLILAGKSFRRCEQYFLGFAIGAFINALIFFLLTVSNIPINFPFVYLLHVVVISILLYVTYKNKLWFHFKSHSPIKIFESGGIRSAKNILMIFIALSMACKLFFSLGHALFVPSYYYDTLSQWNMRSRISYEDQKIAFDLNEDRGHSKPQYPILIHSLQIYFNQPQADWNDSRANASTLILSIFAFSAFVLILARITNPLFSLVTLGLFMMIPLVSLHLAQGYGDIHVIEYLMLGILCAIIYINSNRDYKSLIISAILISAASWVKMEGLIFGVIPFIFVYALYFFCKCKSKEIKSMISVPIVAFVLSILWPLLLITKGLPLSPHPGDFSIKWHTEAINLMSDAMFSYGSFGIFWFLVPVFIAFQIYKLIKSKSKCMRSTFVLIFGLITFVESIFIYLLTPNVQFLLNGQTFHRTMLIPLFIFILSIVLYLFKILKTENN
ncbi:hypothetical protein HOF56_02025 [Candidatus Peribacteria bacterium]|jgi:hypothetical protein|nr:hypothetical protein [Candidatus Peribacteria bacterium]MBT4021266.1 hypothetical protein [Candidatus Peribacteria bacterium]MBT4240669.1 hypothetical protein [Candidatus Peribacteria bacterium]MBT4474014.1 hypothetical protein [Candidatus Peribacteria bacterium]